MKVYKILLPLQTKLKQRWNVHFNHQEEREKISTVLEAVWRAKQVERCSTIVDLKAEKKFLYPTSYA